MIKLLLSLITTLFILPTLIFAENNPFERGVSFKEGIVHYSISGSEVGSETLYIKEHGKRRVIYTNAKSKFMRQGKDTDHITHITPEWIYEIDLIEKSTTKYPNLVHVLYEKFKNLPKKTQQHILQNFDMVKDKSIQNISEPISRNTETILGYPCHVESIDGVLTYRSVDQDLILKTQMQILGYSVQKIATKIDKKPLDLNLFVLPKNLKIVDSQEKVHAVEQKAEEILEFLQQENLRIDGESNVQILEKESFQSIIQESIKHLDAL